MVASTDLLTLFGRTSYFGILELRQNFFSGAAAHRGTPGGIAAGCRNRGKQIRRPPLDPALSCTAGPAVALPPCGHRPPPYRPRSDVGRQPITFATTLARPQHFIVAEAGGDAIKVLQTSEAIVPWPNRTYTGPGGRLPQGLAIRRFGFGSSGLLGRVGPIGRMSGVVLRVDGPRWCVFGWRRPLWQACTPNTTVVASSAC